jgi:hypothetical protein
MNFIELSGLDRQQPRSGSGTYQEYLSRNLGGLRIAAIGTNSADRQRFEKMVISANRAAILIVEDESLNRMNILEMTKEAGFEAVEAANAVKQFPKFASTGDRIRR